MMPCPPWTRLHVRGFPVICSLCAVLMVATPSGAQSPPPACEELIQLYIELAERSGQVITAGQARAEVMSENPTNEECGAMLALFPKTQ